MSHLAVCGDDDAMAVRIKLRPSCSTKHLKDIEDPKIDKGTFLCIVDLRSLERQQVIIGHMTNQSILIGCYPTLIITA